MKKLLFLAALIPLLAHGAVYVTPSGGLDEERVMEIAGEVTTNVVHTTDNEWMKENYVFKWSEHDGNYNPTVQTMHTPLVNTFGFATSYLFPVNHSTMSGVWPGYGSWVDMSGISYMGINSDEIELRGRDYRSSINLYAGDDVTYRDRINLFAEGAPISIAVMGFTSPLLDGETDRYRGAVDVSTDGGGLFTWNGYVLATVTNVHEYVSSVTKPIWDAINALDDRLLDLAQYCEDRMSTLRTWVSDNFLDKVTQSPQTVNSDMVTFHGVQAENLAVRGAIMFDHVLPDGSYSGLELIHTTPAEAPEGYQDLVLELTGASMNGGKLDIRTEDDKYVSLKTVGYIEALGVRAGSIFTDSICDTATPTPNAIWSADGAGDDLWTEYEHTSLRNTTIAGSLEVHGITRLSEVYAFNYGSGPLLRLLYDPDEGSALFMDGENNYMYGETWFNRINIAVGISTPDTETGDVITWVDTRNGDWDMLLGNLVVAPGYGVKVRDNIEGDGLSNLVGVRTGSNIDVGSPHYLLNIDSSERPTVNSTEEVAYVSDVRPGWANRTGLSGDVSFENTDNYAPQAWAGLGGALNVTQFTGLDGPTPVYWTLRDFSTVTFPSGTYFVGGGTWQPGMVNHFLVWQVGSDVFVNFLTASAY